MAKRKQSDIAAIFTSPTPASVAQRAESVPVMPYAEPVRKSAPRPDRAGKRGNLVWINEAAEKSLSIMGIEIDKTKQALLVEAINDLFVKYGRDPIA